MKPGRCRSSPRDLGGPRGELLGVGIGNPGASDPRSPGNGRRRGPSLSAAPQISLERMMLKLKLQYFGHLTRRVDSLEKTLMLGGIGGRRRRGRQSGLESNPGSSLQTEEEAGLP